MIADKEMAKEFAKLDKKLTELEPLTAEEFEDPSDEYLAAMEDASDMWAEMNQETRDLANRLVEKEHEN